MHHGAMRNKLVPSLSPSAGVIFLSLDALFTRQAGLARRLYRYRRTCIYFALGAASRAFAKRARAPELLVQNSLFLLAGGHRTRPFTIVTRRDVLIKPGLIIPFNHC